MKQKEDLRKPKIHVQQLVDGSNSDYHNSNGHEYNNSQQKPGNIINVQIYKADSEISINKIKFEILKSMNGESGSEKSQSTYSNSKFYKKEIQEK